MEFVFFHMKNATVECLEHPELNTGIGPQKLSDLSVFSHGLILWTFYSGAGRKISIKCLQQLTQTFEFSHTAPPNSFRKKIWTSVHGWICSSALLFLLSGSLSKNPEPGETDDRSGSNGPKTSSAAFSSLLPYARRSTASVSQHVGSDSSWGEK